MCSETWRSRPEAYSPKPFLVIFHSPTNGDCPFGLAMDSRSGIFDGSYSPNGKSLEQNLAAEVLDVKPAPRRRV